MQQAADAFQKGDYATSIKIYSDIIDKQQPQAIEALLNRASTFYTQGQYNLSLIDAQDYIKSCDQKPKVQGFIILANSLIKKKALLTADQKDLLQKGKALFPENKKILDTLKIIQEIQITQDQDEYMDKIFEKLLSEPKIRNYMSEESFLTKVEKMVKNPSLASVLIKMDPRLADVQEIILMAEQ